MAALTTQPLAKNDVWSMLDNILNALGIHCGMPLGIGEQHITTEFKPLASLLKDLNPKTGEEKELETVTDAAGITWSIRRQWLVNTPWKGHFGRAVIIENVETKKCRLVFLPHKPAFRRFDMLMSTLGCSNSYLPGKAEEVAQRRLFRELKEQQRNQYIVAGAFPEVGKSGIIYMIRKGRPTLAIKQNSDGSGTVLCALCLHPVAFYTGTWAGVLPPSDEALAHLAMIRQSEKFYWRKANQIRLEEETSGV